MTKDNKVNYVKLWLQKFGDRNNETFHTEVEACGKIWNISMQYGFSNDGDEIIPFNWCTHSFKHTFDSSITDRSEEELDEIINKLKIKKSFY